MSIEKKIYTRKELIEATKEKIVQILATEWGMTNGDFEVFGDLFFMNYRFCYVVLLAYVLLHEEAVWEKLEPRSTQNEINFTKRYDQMVQDL